MSQTLNAAQLLGRLRLRQVALLLELRERGSLRAAAAAMGMTQPAATKMLQELESAVGTRLAEREGRGLKLTAAGGTVVAHFEGLRGSMEALARDLQQLQSGGGRLAIGSILAPSPTLLTRTVTQLKREKPRLLVSVLTETSDRLLELLADGTLDLVIGRITEGHPHRDYLFRPLASEALSVVTGPQHAPASARRIGLASLVQQPWILQPRGSPLRELLEQEFRHLGVDGPGDVIETASILTATFLLAEAPLLAVIPTSLAERYAERGLLQVLPVRLQHALEPYGSIVRRGRPLGAAATRFLGLLHGERGTDADA